MQEQLEPLALSIRQTARAAQVSETYIRGVIRNGKLRAVKFGRIWRVPRSEVLRMCGESGAKETGARRRHGRRKAT